MTKKSKSILNEIVKCINKDQNLKKMPPEIKCFIMEQLKSLDTVKFPVITMKEDDWVVAHNPILDISAQGKTEEEAMENLKAMTDDFMTDPDTPKPKVETIFKMQVGLKDISVKMPFESFQREGHNAGKNTPVTTGHC